MEVESSEQDEQGQTLLSRISTEMVRAQKKHFGKGPTQAKSYFIDDMLFVVMKGGMTTAEQTMRDFGEGDKVRDFRQTFENEMTGTLTSLIEDLTERKVLTYQSQILFDPDRVIGIFVFDAPVEQHASRNAVDPAPAALSCRGKSVARDTRDRCEVRVLRGP